MAGRGLGEDAGMEFERGGQVFGEIGPVVAAGINVEFMRDVARGERAVQRIGARVKAVVVLRAAIEVDSEVREADSAREGQRAYAIPERAVRRGAEDVPKMRRRPLSAESATLIAGAFSITAALCALTELNSSG